MTCAKLTKDIMCNIYKIFILLYGMISVIIIPNIGTMVDGFLIGWLITTITASFVIKVNEYKLLKLVTMNGNMDTPDRITTYSILKFVTISLSYVFIALIFKKIAYIQTERISSITLFIYLYSYFQFIAIIAQDYLIRLKTYKQDIELFLYQNKQ